MKKYLAILTLILCYGSQNAWADSPIIKFSRGIENIVTSPVEYPIQFIELNHRGKSVAVTALTGTLYGTVCMLGRIAGGAVEAVTFLFPVPEGYKPMFYPATPLDSAKEQAQRIAAEKKASQP